MTPGQPLPHQWFDPTKLYTLFYRSSNIPNVHETFYHEGDLKSAINRGIEHCQLMGYHYQYVKPFISNFKWKEEKRLKGTTQGNEP